MFQYITPFLIPVKQKTTLVSNFKPNTLTLACYVDESHHNKYWVKQDPFYSFAYGLPLLETVTRGLMMELQLSCR